MNNCLIRTIIIVYFREVIKRINSYNKGKNHQETKNGSHNFNLKRSSGTIQNCYTHNVQYMNLEP